MGEKVFSPSYSSAILAPPPCFLLLPFTGGHQNKQWNSPECHCNASPLRQPPPPHNGRRTPLPPTLTGLHHSSSPQAPGRFGNQVASPGRSLVDLIKPWRKTLILIPSRKDPPGSTAQDRPIYSQEEPWETPGHPRTLLVPTSAPPGTAFGKLRSPKAQARAGGRPGSREAGEPAVRAPGQGFLSRPLREPTGAERAQTSLVETEAGGKGRVEAKEADPQPRV